jgi:phosphatidylglycerophosphate synthase
MPTMSPPRRYSYQEVVAGKVRDSWWTEVLIEPFAIRLVRLLADHTPTMPNQLTALSAMLTVAAAGGLLEGGRFALIAGALLFQLSLLADCMDGRLARLTGEVTALGGWFGAAAGRARFMMCALALFVGQYAGTQDRTYLLLGAMALSCYAVVEIIDGLVQRLPGGLVDVGGASAAPARLSQGAWISRGERTARRVRAARRPFARPVTEVEFGVAVCVIAPQTGAYVPIIIVASAALLICELTVLGGAVRLYLRARPGRSLRTVGVAASPYGVADPRSHRS